MSQIRFVSGTHEAHEWDGSPEQLQRIRGLVGNDRITFTPGNELYVTTTGGDPVHVRAGWWVAMVNGHPLVTSAAFTWTVV